MVCRELCRCVPNPAGFRYRGVLDASFYYVDVLEEAVYKRLGGGRGRLYVFEAGDRLYAGAPVFPPGFYLVHHLPEGAQFAEYPAPPYVARASGELVWSRFVSSDFKLLFLPGGLRADVDDRMAGDLLDLSNHPEPAAEVLLLRYRGKWLKPGKRWERMFLELLDAKFPGTGKLTGEEFRIVEPDADYLRLVGRGGDEHLAWDFVLGTLDTGEWVLMAEDGLYLARQEGGRVVVEGPYGGFLQEVRGPPLAYKYPVVPTRIFRHAAALGAYVVHDVSLLKWPLTAGPAARRPADLPPPSVLLGVLKGVGYCCELHKAYRTGE